MDREEFSILLNFHFHIPQFKVRKKGLKYRRETPICTNKQIPNYFNNLISLQNPSCYLHRSFILRCAEREEMVTPKKYIRWKLIVEKAMEVSPMSCSEIEILIPS